MSELERLDALIGEVGLRLLRYERSGGTLTVERVTTTILNVFDAYRDLLANGQRVEWCEVHRSEGSEPVDGYAICWYYGNAVAMNQRVQIEPCRIVSKLLSVYPKEAENG